jgi:hypothetical protein
LECCAAQRQICDTPITIFLLKFSALIRIASEGTIVFILRCNSLKKCQSKFPVKLFADADHSFHVGVISGHFADEDVTQPETADVAGPPQAFDDLRGTLRNFELKVGVAGTAKFEARIR